MTTTPLTLTGDRNLDAACAAVSGEIARITRITALSPIAVGKLERLSRAVDVNLAALALLLVAAVLAVTG
ncbi:hypothetical protein [Streptomyces sp. NPDC046925]|uniref:hypothetical protein n=1 Tax=Streptomyces sp. NPDC046925 TaxID=3155375 RepID=UPI0033C880BA